MKVEEALEEIKKIRKREKDKNFAKFKNNELLFGALALIGAAYSQIRNQGIEMDAQEFWPFGEFRPNLDPKKNLIEACNMILSEIERI